MRTTAYQSQAVFSRALKRLLGVAPGLVRRRGAELDPLPASATLRPDVSARRFEERSDRHVRDCDRQGSAAATHGSPYWSPQLVAIPSGRSGWTSNQAGGRDTPE